MKKGTIFSPALYRFTLSRLFIPSVVFVTLCTLLFSGILYMNVDSKPVDHSAPLQDASPSSGKETASAPSEEQDDSPSKTPMPEKTASSLSFSQIYCATTLCLPLSSILVYFAFFQLRRRKNADFIDALPLSRAAVFFSTVLAALSAMILSVLALWLILTGASELMSEQLLYNMSASQLGAGLLNELVLLVFFAALFSFGISISGRLLPSLFIGFLPVYTVATFFLGMLLMYAPFIPLFSLPLTALPLPDISLPFGGESIHLELSLEHLFAAAVLPVDGLVRSAWFLGKVTPAALPGVFSDRAAGRVICLVIAAVFFVAALLIYSKRKSETAGKEGFPIVADLLLPALLFAPGLSLGITVILYSLHFEKTVFSLFSLLFLLPLAPLLIVYLIARGRLCVKRWRQVLLCLLPTLLCLALAFGGQLGLSALASADLPADAIVSVDFTEELTTLCPNATPKHHGDYQRLQITESDAPDVLKAVADGLDFRLLLPFTWGDVKAVKIRLKNGLVIGRLMDERVLTSTVMNSGERTDVNADDFEGFYVVLKDNQGEQLSIPLTKKQAERYIACYNDYSTEERKKGEETLPNVLPISLKVTRAGYEEYINDPPHHDHTPKTEVEEPYSYSLCPPDGQAEQLLADLLFDCLEKGLSPEELTHCNEPDLKPYAVISRMRHRLNNLKDVSGSKKDSQFVYTCIYVQGTSPLKDVFYERNQERDDPAPTVALYDILMSAPLYTGQKLDSDKTLALVCTAYLLDNQYANAAYLPVVLSKDQLSALSAVCTN